MRPTRTGNSACGGEHPVNRHNAPAVPNSVDATRFLTQPCAALVPSQLQVLELDSPGVPDTDSSEAHYSGPACTWYRGGLPRGMVAFGTANKNGLADIYRAHEDGQFSGYWVETTVDGYPAVFTSSVDDRRQGFCSLITGISDTMTMLVSRDLTVGQDACEPALRTTSLILKTLRGG
ncbi:DUF3558 domain-containing protein [Kibdelosporangium lantanae]